MQSLIAVFGTLLGGVVGALGTYVTQRVGYKRESVERLTASRRVAYAEFLTAAHEVYREVNRIHRSQKYGELTQEDAWRNLRAVSPHSAQAALESLRFLSTDETAAAAAKLWQVVRGTKVARGDAGSSFSSADLREWRESYWACRLRVVNAGRLDTGLPELDWSVAGAGWHPQLEA